MAQLSLSRSNCTAMGSNMPNLAFSNGGIEFKFTHLSLGSEVIEVELLAQP